MLRLFGCVAYLNVGWCCPVQRSLFLNGMMLLAPIIVFFQIHIINVFHVGLCSDLIGCNMAHLSKPSHRVTDADPVHVGNITYKPNTNRKAISFNCLFKRLRWVELTINNSSGFPPLFWPHPTPQDQKKSDPTLASPSMKPQKPLPALYILWN